MGQQGSWLVPMERKYGGSVADPTTPATRDATAVTTVAPVVVPALSGMTSPRDPMFWFAVIAAGTVGLMAYSTMTLA